MKMFVLTFLNIGRFVPGIAVVVFLLSNVADHISVQAHICKVRGERGTISRCKLVWVLDHPNPCACTSVVMGGFSRLISQRHYEPATAKRPLISKNIITIRNHYGLHCDQATREIGWTVKNREFSGNANVVQTWVTPIQFTSNGFVTHWQYWAGRSVPFRAMVLRNVDNGGTFYDIIGINDIPAGDIQQIVTYQVPDDKRINVEAGDVIGFAWNSPGPKHVVLGNADDSDVLPLKLFLGRSPDDLNANDRIDASASHSHQTRAYSIMAIIMPVVSRHSASTLSTIVPSTRETIGTEYATDVTTETLGRKATSETPGRTASTSFSSDVRSTTTSSNTGAGISIKASSIFPAIFEIFKVVSTHSASALSTIVSSKHSTRETIRAEYATTVTTGTLGRTATSETHGRTASTSISSDVRSTTTSKSTGAGIKIKTSTISPAVFEILTTTTPEVCSEKLGMESRDIPDSSITASDHYGSYSPSEGRLNVGKFWGCVPASCGETPWIQADIGYQTDVSGIITQGNGVSSTRNWVTTLMVSSFEMTMGDNEVFVTDANGEVKVFQANTDEDTPVTSTFPHPVFSRIVRITCLGRNEDGRYWNIRFELLGCSRHN